MLAAAHRAMKWLGEAEPSKDEQVEQWLKHFATFQQAFQDCWNDVGSKPGVFRTLLDSAGKDADTEKKPDAKLALDKAAARSAGPAESPKADPEDTLGLGNLGIGLYLPDGNELAGPALAAKRNLTRFLGSLGFGRR